MSILYNMTIFSVYPIEIITGEWGAIQILPVPCPPLIEVALYYLHTYVQSNSFFSQDARKKTKKQKRQNNPFAKYDLDCTIVTILYMINYTAILECISFSIICTFRNIFPQ